MVTLQGKQVWVLLNILNLWMGVKGLPITFQRAILLTRKRLAKEQDLLEELRKRLIEEYGKRGEDDQIIQREDGTVVFEDERAVNAEWEEVQSKTFECPGISLADLESHADKLGLTPGQLDALLDEQYPLLG